VVRRPPAADCGRRGARSRARAEGRRRVPGRAADHPHRVQSGEDAGGIHDYFSQADYSWPDPTKPDGLPVRQPGRLVESRHVPAAPLGHGETGARVGALGAAYKIAGDRKYADHALSHLRAWFVAPETRMNPSLLYSQAILGSVTGRRVGIIDTIHLIEVSAAIEVMSAAAALRAGGRAAIKGGSDVPDVADHERLRHRDERDRGKQPRHVLVMQVAAFARLLGDEPQLAYCRTRYKTWLLPTRCSRTAASRWRCGARSPTATRCSSSINWRRLRRSSRRPATTSLRSRYPTPVAQEGRRLHAPVHRRQIAVDVPRDVMYFRVLAGAPRGADLRGAGIPARPSTSSSGSSCRPIP